MHRVAFGDAADAGHRNTRGHAGTGHGLCPLGGRGEQQFVVVASAERTQPLHGHSLHTKHRTERQRIHLDHRAHPGAPQHMAQVTEQSVRQVDGAAGHTSQGHAQRDAGLRQLHRATHQIKGLAVKRGRCAKHFERKPRIAERTADVKIIAKLGARAQQRAGPSGRIGRRHLAEHADANVERAARGVAADQLATMSIGQRQQTPREAFEKSLVDSRQREREAEGQGLGAARSQIAQIDGQRLVTEPLGRHGGQEMTALDQHVARHRDLHAGLGGPQRAVIPDAQHRAACRAIEVAGDQIEFAE